MLRDLQKWIENKTTHLKYYLSLKAIHFKSNKAGINGADYSRNHHEIHTIPKV